eukprot:SAG22_NODE_17587_length_302_cov_0.921182_1_plen_42_part_01
MSYAQQQGGGPLGQREAVVQTMAAYGRTELGAGVPVGGEEGL